MDRQSTSVLVPRQAADALAAAATKLGTSREVAARLVLAEHLAAQRDRSIDDRLVHISTVLRFPPAPLPEKPDPRVRLPLRLDPGVDEEFVELAFRLPGQPRRQGHRDYGARPLADALVTAVALREPFEVEGLEGLPSVLRWCEAIGLWRLVVAATRTAPELQILKEESALSARLREQGGTVWHAPWRFEVALAMARRLLRPGVDVEKNLSLLGG